MNQYYFDPLSYQDFSNINLRYIIKILYDDYGISHIINTYTLLRNNLVLFWDYFFMS